MMWAPRLSSTLRRLHATSGAGGQLQRWTCPRCLHHKSPPRRGQVLLQTRHVSSSSTDSPDTREPLPPKATIVPPPPTPSYSKTSRGSRGSSSPKSPRYPTLKPPPAISPSNVEPPPAQPTRPARAEDRAPTRHVNHPPLPPPPRQRRRWSWRVLIPALATAGAIGLFLGREQVDFYWQASQRTARVMSTLGICINDYRVTLNLRDNTPAPEYDALLKECHQRCATRTLHAMEKNGSIFIKLGQHLSSLNYLLPSEWCDTFIPLQDRCPVSSYESIAAMVLHDTESPIEEHFSSFEHEPLGSASLAQVHVAHLASTGEKVAVKVQHPDLDKWAPLDLALTKFTFATLKRFFPEYDLTWLSEEMQVSLPRELDFELEARNATRTAEYFASIKACPLVIPEVKWSQRRILVMEYVTGARPDDLAYLDAHGIDRDEVSAALARIFNEMIFGDGAPLHCDPHGGNLAVRYNPSRHRVRGGRNFDIILYDHGLYRDIPLRLKRDYAHLWLAVLANDDDEMRKYAKAVAGISDQQFPLFASAITGRDYLAIHSGSVTTKRTDEEKQHITDALGDGLLPQLVQLLAHVPRIILLILKTNDLTRSLDANLHTRQGPERTFLILARYAARTVYEEALDEARSHGRDGARRWWRLLRAWVSYTSVRVRLRVFEVWVTLRRGVGLGSGVDLVPGLEGGS